MASTGIVLVTTSHTIGTGMTYTSISPDALSMLMVALAATVDQSSVPADPGSFAAILGSDAVAVGQDTLAIGDISGVLGDYGPIIALDGSAAAAAASMSPDGQIAFTDASTFAGISGGTNFVLLINQETDSLQQSESGSTATSTSSTTITAYVLQLDNPDAGAPVLQTADPATDGTGDMPAADSPLDTGMILPLDGDIALDGNIALVTFDGLAIGEDTYASADVSALAIEDQLSLASIMVVLGVG